MERRERKSQIIYITHKGKRILHIDHSAVEDLPNLEKTREFFAQARREVDSHPRGSVYLLTSMSPRMRFNSEMTALQKEFSQANTPYVRKSAVVGVTATMRAILATLRFFTGREIRAFETTEEALDWLAE